MASRCILEAYFNALQHAKNCLSISLSVLEKLHKSGFSVGSNFGDRYRAALSADPHKTSIKVINLQLKSNKLSYFLGCLVTVSTVSAQQHLEKLKIAEFRNFGIKFLGNHLINQVETCSISSLARRVFKFPNNREMKSA